MTSIEQLASDIAERIGTVGPYLGGSGRLSVSYYNEEFIPKVTEILDVLQRFERAGRLVIVTDDSRGV